MGKPLRVLIVDDSDDDALLMIHALKKGGYDPLHERVEDAEAMRQALEKRSWDVILCDYQMPQFNGLAAITLSRQTASDIPLIIVSGAIGEETAVECMRSGAHDYVMKDNLSRLVPAMERELREAESRSQRRRAEEALRRTEENFRRSLDESPLGVRIVSPEGETIYANQAILDIYGFDSMDELKATPTQKRYTPESLAQFKTRREKRKRGDPLPTEYEICIIKKNTEVCHLQVFRKEILWNGEKQFQVIYLDITDRKQTEENLRTHQVELEMQNQELGRIHRELDISHTRYFNLYDLAPVGYCTLSKQGLIIEANLTAATMLGVPRGALVKQPLSRFILADDQDIYHRGRKNLFKTPSADSPSAQQVCELRMVKQDGITFWAHLAMTTSPNLSTPLQLSPQASSLRQGSGQGEQAGQDGDNAPVCRVVLSDITDSKRAEVEKQNLKERLQRAEKMEALGQLAGGVAHDLNNILGILTGYSELLLGEIPEGSQCKIYVNKILQSTTKGAVIIEDLLTLARRGVTVSEVTNLNTVVADYLQTPVFEKMKEYHPQVTFRIDCDNDLLNIKGSSVHLEKTLMNLVSNAAEAVSGAGEVTIRTENRHLDKPIQAYDKIEEGDYAVLTISDTGMGISVEDREKIFEPFYTKKKMGRSGTGLGLAIVWGAVKDHNGYIDIQTEVGKGATFTLYFPVTQEELITRQGTIPIEQYMGQGESVLVVDDIEEQREIASRLLTKLGYDVRLASSGEEAVEYLKSNKADILVLDMIMTPGIDGLETYQRILKINPEQKAIMVSGFSETDRTTKVQKLGIGAYVKKPYVLEKIGVAIRDELKR
ncbi:MAG: response regulator [Syntrophales bacterium]